MLSYLNPIKIERLMIELWNLSCNKTIGASSYLLPACQCLYRYRLHSQSRINKRRLATICRWSSFDSFYWNSLKFLKPKQAHALAMWLLPATADSSSLATQSVRTICTRYTVCTVHLRTRSRFAQSRPVGRQRRGRAEQLNSSLPMESVNVSMISLRC